jgi:hypothetical protein
MKAVTIPSDALARFRAASSEFALTPKSRASRLEAVRDDIAALRGKGASFRTISELLGRCGIRASDTCVMRFCRRVLGETPARAGKARRRDSSRQTGKTATTTAGSPNGQASPSAAAAPSEAAQVALLDDLLSYQPPPDDKPVAQGGPRIAKIKFASPSEL